MFKLTFIVSLMFIGTCLLAARQSCDSCGNECMSACGTRRFRTCCFNYLRKKRGPEAVKFWLPNSIDAKLDNSPRPKLPYFILENIPEQIIPNLIADEYKLYNFKDNVEDRSLA